MTRTFDLPSTGSCLHVCFLSSIIKIALVTAIVLFYRAMTFDIHSTGSCLHVGFLWFLRKTALVTAIVICLLLLCRLTTLVPELVCMFVFYGSYVIQP